MYIGLLHLHSVLRYIILILLIVVLVKSLLGWQQRKPFGKTDDRLSLFLMISVHIQLVLGLILIFLSPLVNFGEMADKVRRYWSVEHMTMNIIAIILITLGRTRMKKLTLPEAKNRTLFLFTLAGLVVLLVSLSQMPDRPMLGGHALHF